VGVGVGVSSGGAAHPARITQARTSASRVRILTCISLRGGFRYMAFVDGNRAQRRVAGEYLDRSGAGTGIDTPEGIEIFLRQGKKGFSHELRRPNANEALGTSNRSRNVVPMSGICTEPGRVQGTV